MKKLNIGIFHYIANFTDGVSLEMNKWKRIFEEMGHRVHLIAGKFGNGEDILIEEMYHHRPEARLLKFNTFSSLKEYPNEEIYRAELYRLANQIEEKISKAVVDNGIDFFVPQNVWSVAASPSVSIALTNVMRKFKIPTLAHNHDFYFERIDGFSLTCNTAAELVDRYYPPRDKLVKHVVINSLTQKELFGRKGINSTVVPNTFDFDPPHWIPDEYNKDLVTRIGLKEDDIFILQATRIVTRKGIELAIDFVKAINSPIRRTKLREKGLYDGRKFTEKSRIILVFAGYALDDSTGNYKNQLIQKSKDLNVHIKFIDDFISDKREIIHGEKLYSLWDSYVYADLITYPSLWEGWGNQLLEAVKAKKPFVLFEYPVYTADIKDKGFSTISLGKTIANRDKYGLVTIDRERIETAADEAIELLTDLEKREKVVDHNFIIGKKHYSMEALYSHLNFLMEEYGNNPSH